MPIKFIELHKIVISIGFIQISQNGSHVKFKHVSTNQILIIPNHPTKEIGSGLLDRLIKQISDKSGISKKQIKNKYNIKV